MRWTVLAKPSLRWLLGGFAVLAFLVPMLYAYKVNHIWEDYLITFRHSQNLCEGNGLVYQPGERVHGFTSPLGVLLPALTYVLTAKGSYLSALWLFRVLSAVAFAGAGLILLQTLRAHNAPVRAVVALAALLLLEVKAVEFVTDGMETAFMLLFFAASFYFATVETKASWLWTGLCWGGLMWTRPDGCVYVAALTLATFLYSQKPWREVAVSIVKSSLVTTLVYGPWVLWAWQYYGSPVPNTIIAKSAYHNFHAQTYTEIIQRTIDSFPATGKLVFGPIYAFNPSEWPAWHPAYLLALTLFCSIYWMFPIADRVGRAASLCFVVLATYLTVIQSIFPWYVPPVLACGLVVLASGIVTYSQTVVKNQWVAVSIPVLVLTPIVWERAWLFHMTERSMRIQQREIETNVRTEVGNWLKEHMAPGDRVFLEPMGYIGYFSQAKILDTPGLVAPEVTRLLKEGIDPWDAAVILRPEWLVVRPWEYDRLNRGVAFRSAYTAVKAFDARQALDAMKNVPNKSFLMYDACFVICQKNPAYLPVPSGGLSLGSEAVEPYLGPGWETLDARGGERWTVDHCAAIRFQAEAWHTYRLTLKLRPYLLPGHWDLQTVRVRLNGVPLRQLDLRTESTEDFELPADIVRENNELTLEMPNAQSPKHFGATEGRRLGLAVASLVLEKASAKVAYHAAADNP
jgi:hypothetical protein